MAYMREVIVVESKDATAGGPLARTAICGILERGHVIGS